jgi:hypothetical protein
MSKYVYLQLMELSPESMYICCVKSEQRPAACTNDNNQETNTLYDSWILLPPFHNVSYFSIFYIHINVNKSIYIYIYMSRFININMNVRNARMTYIVKRRE